MSHLGYTMVGMSHLGYTMVGISHRCIPLRWVSLTGVYLSGGNTLPLYTLWWVTLSRCTPYGGYLSHLVIPRVGISHPWLYLGFIPPGLMWYRESSLLPTRFTVGHTFVRPPF